MDNIDGFQVELPNYPRYGEEPYVGLGQLLVKIEQAIEHNHGNGVVSAKIDSSERTVEFVVERTAYGGNDIHCGTESYTASLPIRKLRRSWIVFPSEMDVEWTPACPKHVYTRDEAIAFLDEHFDGKWPHEGVEWRRDMLGENPTDDDIIDLAHEEGMSMGDYQQPDDDFAWQHLHHGFLEPMIEEIKAEHDKLHADAALRRAGVRTDLTEEQLAAIAYECAATMADAIELDTPEELALREMRLMSTQDRLARIFGNPDPDAAIEVLGFNPWINKEGEL